MGSVEPGKLASALLNNVTTVLLTVPITLVICSELRVPPYPFLFAEVDGVPTPIYRANVSLRGIALPRGQHTVRFTYDALPFFRGLWVTLIALGALVVWFGAAAWRQRA